MGKRPQTGICHICRNKGPLSFEHVPPESAFNDQPIVSIMGERLLNLDLDEEPKGPVSQRGAGAYTLCPECNNNTGSWYGRAYAEWAEQGINAIVNEFRVSNKFEAKAVAERIRHNPYLNVNFRVFPLRVIKQIFCMFFSVNPPTFAEAHEDLVRFVLNKKLSYANPSLRVFVYLNAALMVRQSAVAGRLNFYNRGSHIFSEFAFPPFGFMLAVDGKSPDRRLYEIAGFSDYGYEDWTDVHLRLPVFQPCRPWPGDLRSFAEVIKDTRANLGET